LGNGKINVVAIPMTAVAVIPLGYALSIRQICGKMTKEEI